MTETFPPYYQEIRNGLEWLGKSMFRLEVEGIDHIPPPGEGVLLCPSHENYSDPFFLGAAIPHRYLRFLGEPQAFTMPVVGQLAEKFGMQKVEVAQGKSTHSGQVKQALVALADHIAGGGVGVVFPEGQIKHWLGADSLKRFGTGAVRVAAIAGRPIVPAAIYGGRWAMPNIASLDMPGGKEQLRVWAPILLPAKVMIAFGEPLDVDPRCNGDKEIAASETRRLRRQVAALRFGLKRRYPGFFG
jgi:1-acyl-sn-glycerol-3-phosphate acyltransferase